MSRLNSVEVEINMAKVMYDHQHGENVEIDSEFVNDLQDPNFQVCVLD